MVRVSSIKTRETPITPAAQLIPPARWAQGPTKRPFEATKSNCTNFQPPSYSGIFLNLVLVVLCQYFSSILEMISHPRVFSWMVTRLSIHFDLMAGLLP
jgi:hypothetical protein